MLAEDDNAALGYVEREFVFPGGAEGVQLDAPDFGAEVWDKVLEFCVAFGEEVREGGVGGFAAFGVYELGEGGVDAVVLGRAGEFPGREVVRVGGGGVGTGPGGFRGGGVFADVAVRVDVGAGRDEGLN